LWSSSFSSISKSSGVKLAGKFKFGPTSPSGDVNWATMEIVSADWASSTSVLMAAGKAPGAGFEGLEVLIWSDIFWLTFLTLFVG
jgi:hypothetical protein